MWKFLELMLQYHFGPFYNHRKKFSNITTIKILFIDSNTGKCWLSFELPASLFRIKILPSTLHCQYKNTILLHQFTTAYSCVLENKDMKRTHPVILHLRHFYRGSIQNHTNSRNEKNNRIRLRGNGNCGD